MQEGPRPRETGRVEEADDPHAVDRLRQISTWSLAILTDQPFLDLDTMIRTHGELNALAVLLGIATSQAQPPRASAMDVAGIGTA